MKEFSMRPTPDIVKRAEQVLDITCVQEVKRSLRCGCPACMGRANPYLDWMIGEKGNVARRESIVNMVATFTAVKAERKNERRA